MKHFSMRFFPALLWVLAGLVLFSNCKRASDKAAEETAEAIMENATGLTNLEISQQGEKVSFTTDELKLRYDGTKQSWPEDIPSEVPVLKGIKIVGTATNKGPDADSWTIIMEGASVQVLDEYSAELKKAGFETAVFKMDDAGSVSGEKGNLVVSCMVGEDQVVISVQRKKN